ncbi:MAG TPA: tetratricopeptide repeat protein, partial [Myxococcota bacterium]|nr:tetratricopeptide repeat protein [Myxococcota bacterium]
MEANLRRAEERFEADPTDARAFEALEEHYFLQGDWPELVRLYERRLDAADLRANPEAAARLCFRLGQVLEERCLQTDRAAEFYQEAARRAPRFRAPLTQLRRIYAAREAWDLVLQVAEVEAAFPLQPFERAAFFAQMGAIWFSHMRDAQQGLDHYQRALEADPEHLDALRGVARIYAELGDAGAAAASLERVTARVRGVEAAPALVELARLCDGPLAQPERAGELYKSALAQDPRCQEALEALCARAQDAGEWGAVADLLERRFELATGATRRLAIALEAGRLQLEQLRNPAAARLWYGRALELMPHEDPSVYLALADVERVAGNREAAARWLDRAATSAPEAVPIHVLIESAFHAGERGDPERALVSLRRALDRAPGDRRVLEALAQVLERLGRSAELAAVLEREAALLADDPGARAEIWLRLGALHERSGEADAARRALERAVEAHPSSAAGIDALAASYSAAALFDELRALLEGAREHASGRRALDLSVRLGDLLLERFEDVEAARAAFEAALAVDGADPGALQGLERAALRTGDEQAVLEAFEREAAVTTDRGRLAFLVWELVRLHERRDEPEEALLWIERLAQVVPEDRRVLECCARLQEQLGHDDERVETLERLDLVLHGAERAANRRKLSELAWKRGDLERAIERLYGALEADPADVAALRALLEPLERTGRVAELADVRGRLAEHLEGDERAACLAARIALLESLGDVQGALSVAERLRAEGPARTEITDTVERLLEQAARWEDLAALLEERRRDEASSPERARALALRRADLLRERLGRPADAAALYREALPGLDGEARTHAAAALEDALRASGDRDGLAELLAERAERASDPAEADALSLERAALLDESGRREDARAVYERLAAAGGARAAEAEERLQALLERTGAFDALCARLEAEAGARRGADAAELLERAAGLRRERLRDAEGARAALERATSLAPDRASAWHALARLHEEADRPLDVVRALEGELATDPEPARARDLHARAAALLCEQDDRRAAIEHFLAILALDPTDTH